MLQTGVSNTKAVKSRAYQRQLFPFEYYSIVFQRFRSLVLTVAKTMAFTMDLAAAYKLYRHHGINAPASVDAKQRVAVDVL